MEREKNKSESENIDVTEYVRKILRVVEEEFPDDITWVREKLSDEDDWDSFRSLYRGALPVLLDQNKSATLQKIKNEIDEYAAKATENDTTFR